MNVSDRAPRRWLVTGGAGFLGINLCRKLLALGDHVRSLDIEPFDYPECDRVDVVTGDVRDPAIVADAMRDADVVVHAAAALPLCAPALIASVDVDGTAVMIREAVRQRIPRFVFISSTAVYGVPKHHPLRETDPLHGVGPYGEAKIRAEALCADARKSGMCVSILRPKTFVGPERLGVFELLFDWAYDGCRFPVLGAGNNRYQLLDVADLCEAIVLVAGADAERVSDTFNVAAGQFGTMRENFQAVLDRAGHGRRVIALPARPVRAALRLLDALHLSPLYPWVYETAAEESEVSIDRIRQRLGFHPRYSNAEALVRNYDWYVAQRARIRGQTGVSHRVPWRRGALALAKWFFR